MLVGGLLGAMNEGADFLGRATCKGSGLIVSEEDEGALRQRAETLGLLKIPSEYTARNTGALSSDWPSLIDRATERALSRGHALLVVDTLPGLAGLGGDEENDAGAVGERLRPLQQAAGEGLAVLFLHHMNRYGQPRGSRALSGVVDVSIRFHRKGNRFSLTADSRYPTATPATWSGQLIRDRPWRYESLEKDGSRLATRRPKQEGRDALLAAVASAGAKGITYQEIGSLPGLSKDVAKRLLPPERGVTVERLGAGTKGDPYRWLSLPAFGAVQSNSERS